MVITITTRVWEIIHLSNLGKELGNIGKKSWTFTNHRWEKFWGLPTTDGIRDVVGSNHSWEGARWDLRECKKVV
jgi:hypothetical protein